MARDRRDAHGAEQRLNVALDPAAIDRQSAGFFRGLAARAHLPGQRVLEIVVAKLGDRQRLPLGDFLSAGIAAFTTSPSSRLASSRAISGVQGAPWRPI